MTVTSSGRIAATVTMVAVDLSVPSITARRDSAKRPTAAAFDADSVSDEVFCSVPETVASAR